MITQSDLDNMWNNLKAPAGYADTDNPTEEDIAKSIATKLSQEMLTDWDTRGYQGYNTAYWHQPYIYQFVQEMYFRSKDAIDRGKAWIDINIPDKYRNALWLAMARSVNGFIFKFLEGSLPPNFKPGIEAGKTFVDTLIRQLLVSENLSPEVTDQQTKLLQDLVSKISLVTENIDSKIINNTSMLEQILVATTNMGSDMQKILQQSEQYQTELKEILKAYIEQVKSILDSIPQEIKDEIIILYQRLQILEQQNASAEEIRKAQADIAEATAKANEAIQQNHDKYINAMADIQNVGQILSAFINLFGDAKTAYLYATIIEGSVKIINGIIAIAAGVTATAGTLGPYAAIIVGIIMIVSAIVKSRGPSPEEIIVNYIQILAEQINKFRLEMHERFDRLELLLSDIYRTLIDRFVYLATLTTDNTQLLREIQSTVNIIQTQIEGLQRLINQRFLELYHLDLISLESDAFRALDEYSTQVTRNTTSRNVTEVQLFEYFNRFATWAAIVSADSILNRYLPNTNSLQQQIIALHDCLTTNEEHTLLNLLAEYMSARGTSLLNPLLTNPVAYQQSSILLIRYLWQLQSVWRVSDSHKNLFVNLAYSGIDILNFFTLVKINYNLFAKLLVDYHDTLIQYLNDVDNKFNNKREKLSAQKYQLIRLLSDAQVMQDQLFTEQLFDSTWKIVIGQDFPATGRYKTRKEYQELQAPWPSLDSDAIFFWVTWAAPYHDIKSEQQVKDEIYKQIDIDISLVESALNESPDTLVKALNSALTRITNSEKFEAELKSNLSHLSDQYYYLPLHLLHTARKITVYELFQKPNSFEDKNKMVNDLINKIAEDEATIFINSEINASTNLLQMQLESNFLLLEKYFKIAFKNNPLLLNTFEKFEKIHKLIITKQYIALLDELHVVDKRISNVITRGLTGMVESKIDNICNTLNEGILNEIKLNRTLYQNDQLPADFPDLSATIQQIIQFLREYYGYDFLGETNSHENFRENANYIITQNLEHIYFGTITPDDSIFTMKPDISSSIKKFNRQHPINIPKPKPDPRLMNYKYDYYFDDKIQKLIQHYTHNSVQLLSTQSNLRQASKIIEKIPKNKKDNKFILPIKHNQSLWSVMLITMKNAELQIQYLHPQGMNVENDIIKQLKINNKAYFDPRESAPAIIELSRLFATNKLAETLKNKVMNLKIPITIKPMQDADYKLLMRSSQKKIVAEKPSSARNTSGKRKTSKHFDLKKNAANLLSNQHDKRQYSTLTFNWNIQSKAKIINYLDQREDSLASMFVNRDYQLKILSDAFQVPEQRMPKIKLDVKSTSFFHKNRQLINDPRTVSRISTNQHTTFKPIRAPIQQTPTRPSRIVKHVSTNCTIKVKFI